MTASLAREAGEAAQPSSVFVDACLRRPVPYTPIWIMRQAGRYLPEYRELRSKVDFAKLTHSAELAAEVTLQPVRRYPLDAAILFSDIMTPLQGMGVGLDFDPGPVIREPIRTRAQIDALPALVPERDVPFVLDAIRIVRGAAPRKVPLIGFAGAPFTLLCYLVCGRPSKEFEPARAFLYSQPEAAEALIDHLADAMAAYLAAQAAAGAQALMLFESWAGLLGPREYRRFALRGARRTLLALRRALGRDETPPPGGAGPKAGGQAAPEAQVPLIYFANQGATLFETIATLEADVIGVDWRVPLSAARRMLGPLKALQGNLDPAALFAPRAELERHIDVVLDEARQVPSHIFNLGHGIWPDTNTDAVARMIDYVHEKTVRD